MIKAVNKRDLVRKRDNKPFTLYEIVDHNNVKWSTGRRDLAEEAANLIGKPAQIQGHEEQNNNGYTNYYLDDIFPGNGQPQQPQSTDFRLPQERAQTTTAFQGHVQNPAITQSETDGDKQIRIMRQAAAKVSALISPSATEFWANCDTLLNYFMTGQKPQIVPMSVSDGGTTQTGNKFFADPGPEADKPLFDTDDDIPF